MAEDVVEDVRLLDVVELVGLADELAGREAPVREMLEEDRVRHEAGHADHAPAGEHLQLLVQAIDVGDRVLAERERVEPVEKFVRGAPRQEFRLPPIERLPDGVLRGRVGRPILVDGIVRAVRHLQHHATSFGQSGCASGRAAWKAGCARQASSMRRIHG